MTLDALLGRLEGVRRSGAGWVARCPGHPDARASLSVAEGDAGGILVRCHAGCEPAAIVEALGLAMRDLAPPGVCGRPSRGGATAQHSRDSRANPGASARRTSDRGPNRGGNGATPPDCTLAAYAGAKRLDLGFLARLGVREQPYQRGTALRIPYLGESAEELAVRYRLRLERSEDADDRFRWKSGSKVQPYGLWRIANARALGSLILVEGESDAQTLWSHGIPALGAPGAATWRSEWTDYLDGIEAVFAIAEPDEGGRNFIRKLAAAGLRDRLRVVRLDGFKDASELHCDDPEGFEERFSAALDASTVYVEEAHAEREREAEAAYEECRELAEAPDILHRFAVQLRRRGVVGEERLAKVTYLAMTSRLLSRPVSIVAKGLSSAGKSHTTQQTIAFFPPSAYYALTSMSERALAYSEEPLEHRMFVLYEAAGLEGDFASYLLRSLLSEGRLRYETVEKTGDGVRARIIERPGPTGVIVTTTKLALHPENETRMLSVPVDDSQEQTAAILRAVAEEREATDDDLRPWHALQAWLEGGERRVRVPFAGVLADLVPPVAVRLRRDFGTLLNLVRAHALLHRASRKADADGIVATLEDYAAVRELVADLIGEGVQATVAESVRKTVETVGELLADGREGVTVSALADALRLDKGAASRRFQRARRLGYLVNAEEKKGRPASIRLGEPLPDEAELLPTVATVDEALHEGGQHSTPRNRTENDRPLHGCPPNGGGADTHTRPDSEDPDEGPPPPSDADASPEAEAEAADLEEGLV